MKIKINNLFKVNKSKSKLKNKSKSKNESNKNMIIKNQTFKVYNSEGKIIKYEERKSNQNMEKKNENKQVRIRNGANNYIKKQDDKFELKQTIIKKYNADEYEIEKTKNIEKSNLDNKKIKKKSYVLFLCMSILASYSIYYTYTKYKIANEESYTVYSSQDITDKINLPEEQSSVSNNIDTISKEESVAVSTKVENNIVTKKVKKVEPLKFQKPIEGEILKIYSKDKVIYSKTLELWKIHDGIDIKAEENTIVRAIEKGTVEKIYDDAFYGKTIVIDHGQGYKSSYSNLSDEVFVKEKQTVSKMAKIGKIGKTAIGEIKDESHLHFTLIKNNEICDPSGIFK